ncbi:hypothetical protein PG984_000107 [Apiospora sp. TS-2023a]
MDTTPDSDELPPPRPISTVLVEQDIVVRRVQGDRLARKLPFHVCLDGLKGLMKSPGLFLLVANLRVRATNRTAGLHLHLFRQFHWAWQCLEPMPQDLVLPDRHAVTLQPLFEPHQFLPLVHARHRGVVLDASNGPPPQQPDLEGVAVEAVRPAVPGVELRQGHVITGDTVGPKPLVHVAQHLGCAAGRFAAECGVENLHFGAVGPLHDGHLVSWLSNAAEPRVFVVPGLIVDHPEPVALGVVDDALAVRLHYREGREPGPHVGPVGVLIVVTFGAQQEGIASLLHLPFLEVIEPGAAPVEFALPCFDVIDVWENIIEVYNGRVQLQRLVEWDQMGDVMRARFDGCSIDEAHLRPGLVDVQHQVGHLLQPRLRFRR